jgi:hypothetical protein
MESNYETLKAWADIVIKRFETKIRQLNIISDGNHKTKGGPLINSFSDPELIRGYASQLINDANGDVEKIKFGFVYYGRFPDMGVGRGVKFGQAGIDNNRRVKPWFSKVFFSQVARLGEILEDKTGERAQIAIIEEITNYKS